MNKEYLISKYSFYYHKFQNIHSAGPDLIFYNPCIGYLKKGNAKFLYNGKTYYAKAGDLIYIASQTKYQSIWYGSPDVEWYQISFDFNSKFAFYDYRFQVIKNYPPELLDKMYETFKTSPMLSVAYLYILLDDIYLKMNKTLLIRPDSSIEPAIDYIEKNFASHITISELAKLCHISESTLFEQFKRFFGVTPIGYKHNIMIQHSIELLSNTQISIEEVSRRVGFPSSNYFRKIFVKLIGKTPKELRK